MRWDQGFAIMCNPGSSHVEPRATLSILCVAVCNHAGSLLQLCTTLCNSVQPHQIYYESSIFFVPEWNWDGSLVQNMNS